MMKMTGAPIQSLHARSAAAWLFSCLLLLAASCRGLAVSQAPTPTLLPSAVSATSTHAPIFKTTPTLTPTSAPSLTPTASPSPTVTLTPTTSSSPTPEAAYGIVQLQAFCRYGPGKAYLYSHGLAAGDRVVLEGRNYSGTWVWVQPENLERHCWAAASVMEIHGDVSSLNLVTTRLPYSTLYGPPQQVEAYRSGSVVTVAWESVWMTQDDYRGYLIEASVCQGGQRIPFAIHVDGTSTDIIDEPGCSGASSGKLYTVEKHGYTDPVPIPWP